MQDAIPACTAPEIAARFLLRFPRVCLSVVSFTGTGLVSAWYFSMLVSMGQDFTALVHTETFGFGDTQVHDWPSANGAVNTMTLTAIKRMNLNFHQLSVYCVLHCIQVRFGA